MNHNQSSTQPSDIIETIVHIHTDVEHRLDTVLKEYFASPEFYEDARLTFYQKLNLVRAKHWQRQDHPVWQLIKQLNSLRNDTSHHPTDTAVHQGVTALYSIYASIDGGRLVDPASPQPLAQQVTDIHQLIEAFLQEHVNESAFLNSLSRNLIKAFNHD